MRRIVKKSDSEKKSHKNQIVVGIILIGIMLFGTLGYSFGNGDEETGKIKYNGYDFVQQGNYFGTSLNGVDFVLMNNPKNISESVQTNKSLEDYYQRPLYISYVNSVAAGEIYNNLKFYVERIQTACYEDCVGSDLAIKTCEDNFIIIKESNISRVIQEENCIFIEGKNEDLTKLADKFLLKIFGIDS
jgi:hypothetical protein